MKMTGLRFAPGCHSSPGLKAWGFLAWLIKNLDDVLRGPEIDGLMDEQIGNAVIMAGIFHMIIDTDFGPLLFRQFIDSLRQRLQSRLIQLLKKLLTAFPQMPHLSEIELFEPFPYGLVNLFDAEELPFP